MALEVEIVKAYWDASALLQIWTMLTGQDPCPIQHICEANLADMDISSQALYASFQRLSGCMLLQ